MTPPREYPEYTPPGYYAVFFKDPDGDLAAPHFMMMTAPRETSDRLADVA